MKTDPKHEDLGDAAEQDIWIENPDGSRAPFETPILDPAPEATLPPTPEQ